MKFLARWWINLPIALASFVLGKLGLYMSLPPGYVSALWPAAGLAFAVALIWGGRRVWPGIFIGSLLTNATINPGFTLSTLTFCMASGSTVQALVGAYWLRLRDPDLRVNTPEQVIGFTVVSIAACLIAATIGNATLYAHGVVAAAQIPESMLTWWLGDAFGVQIFTPLVLLIVAPNALWRRRRLAIGLPLLMAFSMCALVYYYVRADEESQLQRNFAAATDPILRELAAMDRTYGQALMLIATSYQMRNEPVGESFHELAAKAHVSLPAFRGIGWVPIIDTARGERLPNLLQSDGKPITVRYPPGYVPPSDGLIAPFVMGYPMSIHSGALGVDLMGDPVRAQALRSAMATGKLTISQPIRLLYANGTPAAMVMMAPVRGTAVRGVVAGLLDLGTLDAQLKKRELDHTVWELRDMSSVPAHPHQAGELSPPKVVQDSAGVIAASTSRALPRFSGATHIDRDGVYVQQTLHIADKHWQIVLHRPHSALVKENSHNALLMLFVAFAACAVFANFALIASGDRERIADEVRDKTRGLNDEIGERRRIETELRESRGFLIDLIENSGAVIFAKSAEGVYQLVNRRWEETTGLTRDKVIGRMDKDLFTPENTVQFRRADLAVMQAGTAIESEEILDDARGRRYFLSIKFPVRNAVGAITGICAITSDITERKKNEVALEQARDAAEAANRAKSQFLATMSHEIRTPMNGILGMAQLLLMDGVDETDRQTFVRTILNSGNSLLNILNDILDLSKVEAGHMELKPVDFAPADLLAETVALFRESAQGKGLGIEASTDVGEARVSGDALRMRQMLSNLIGNAIKFSERGTISVRVTVSHDPALAPERMRLEFSVSDEGIGIPANKISALFQPFVQVDGSATRRFGGTGLGLSIVKRLAELMGGTVGVNSRHGEGSRFWFSAVVSAVCGSGSTEDSTEDSAESRAEISAVASDELSTQPKSAKLATTPTPSAPDASAPWVLVAEDVATNRMVVLSMLGRLKLAYRCAENGVEALQLLSQSRANPPAVILMDCQMPEMDGYAATKAIRRLESEQGDAHTTIIALTADAFPEDRKLCFSAGMDDFLAKPLVFTALIDALRRAGLNLPEFS
jgi:PAS domain S-box-containing protein